jgi:hypothetical protein
VAYHRLHMGSEFIEFGDHIYLQESTGKGWLHGTGRPEINGSGLAVLYVDPFEPRHVRTSIFIVRHQQTWTHLNE